MALEWTIVGTSDLFMSHSLWHISEMHVRGDSFQGPALQCSQWLELIVSVITWPEQSISTHAYSSVSLLTALNVCMRLCMSIGLLLHTVSRLESPNTLTTIVYILCAASWCSKRWWWLLRSCASSIGSGGSRKKIFGGLAPHHLGGNNG